MNRRSKYFLLEIQSDGWVYIWSRDKTLITNEGLGTFALNVIKSFTEDDEIAKEIMEAIRAKKERK